MHLTHDLLPEGARQGTAHTACEGGGGEGEGGGQHAEDSTHTADAELPMICTTKHFSARAKTSVDYPLLCNRVYVTHLLAYN